MTFLEGTEAATRATGPDGPELRLRAAAPAHMASALKCGPESRLDLLGSAASLGREGLRLNGDGATLRLSESCRLRFSAATATGPAALSVDLRGPSGAFLESGRLESSWGSAGAGLRPGP